MTFWCFLNLINLFLLAGVVVASVISLEIVELGSTSGALGLVKASLVIVELGSTSGALGLVKVLGSETALATAIAFVVEAALVVAVATTALGSGIVEGSVTPAIS